MQLDTNDIYNNLKVELSDSYVKKIIEEYVKMSKDCEKYIPFNMDNFSLENALYTYLKLDPENNGPDVSLKREQLNRKIVSSAINDNTLVPSIQNGIKMNPITSTQLGWSTYQSWHLTNDKAYNKDDISYRFYINANSEVIPEMVEKIYSYYKEMDCPFYFKSAFSSKGVKDNIVIYSSKDQLENTLQVIKKLETNDKELISKCKASHLFTASIDDFVGFSTESKTLKGSYTKIMSKIVTDGINDSVNSWIEKHKNLTVGNDKIPIGEYLDKEVYSGKDIKYSERKKRYSEYIKRLGNLLEQINKIEPNFRNTIRSNIKSGLINSGFDPENICFDNTVLKELETNSKNNHPTESQNFNNAASLNANLYPQYDFSFNGLKNTYDGYDLYQGENDSYYVKDKRTGIKITDPLWVDRVMFSKTWVNVTEGDSFSSNNKEIYDDIMSAVTRQDNSDLNLEELRGNLGNPYSQYVIDKVASSPNYTMSLNKWVQRTNMNNNKMINNENGFKK